jgi:hypothetical protein
MSRDERIPSNEFLKSDPAFPGRHSIALDGLIGLLALGTLIDQRQQ